MPMGNVATLVTVPLFSTPYSQDRRIVPEGINRVYSSTKWHKQGPKHMSACHCTCRQPQSLTHVTKHSVPLRAATTHLGCALQAKDACAAGDEVAGVVVGVESDEVSAQHRLEHVLTHGQRAVDLCTQTRAAPQAPSEHEMAGIKQWRVLLSAAQTSFLPEDGKGVCRKNPTFICRGMRGTGETGAAIRATLGLCSLACIAKRCCSEVTGLHSVAHLGNCVFQQHGELHQVVVLDPHDVAMLVGCDDDIGKLLVCNLHSSQDGK